MWLMKMRHPLQTIRLEVDVVAVITFVDDGLERLHALVPVAGKPQWEGWGRSLAAWPPPPTDAGGLA